jgi:hypothetical protein
MIRKDEGVLRLGKKRGRSLEAVVTRKEERVWML